VLTAALSGCASGQRVAHTAPRTAPSQPAGFVGYRWQIAEVRHSATRVAVPQGRRGYVAFSPNGILNADDSVNHYYGHFTSTTNGYHATDVATTLVAYGGHDPITLALMEGIGALTMQDADVVVERLTGNQLELAVVGYHVTAMRAGREAVQPTSVPPTNTRS
jgi:hypothetical protein